MARFPYSLAALLLFAPVAAEATISRAIKFDERVDKAESIVVGTVVDQDSRWDDQHKWILTYSTIRVDKTLKGVPERELTIVTPGGKVGTIVQEVIGVPQFREGEENVVFVRDTQAGKTVAFLEQGNYKVVADARGERMAVPAVSSAVLVDTGHGTAVTPEAPRSLRDFEGAVRETVRRREVMRMELLQKQKEEASISSVLRRNAGWVALALLGAILASWQLLKRS